MSSSNAEVVRASASALASLLDLPPELLLQIAKSLEPKDLPHLQLVCKKLLHIGRDNSLWLEHCFQGSSMYESVWLPRLRDTGNSTNNGGGGSSSDSDNSDNDNTVGTGTNIANNAVANAGVAQHPLAQVPILPNHFNPQMPPNMAGQGNLPQGLPLGVMQHALHQQQHQHNHHHHHHLHNNHPPPMIQLAIQHLQTHFLAGHGAAPTGAGQPQTTDQDEDHSDGQASETSHPDDATVDDDVASNSRQERLRIRANWDPSYPNEGVSWYDEYIHRHAPTVVNWFEPARRRDTNGRWANIEARGVALYRPDNDHVDAATGLEKLLAISPLDDGGICIWDVNGTRGKKGSVYAKSKPGLLFIDGPQGDNNRASKRVDSGVTECVSIDNQRHRAFFAVQSHLVDVDLQTMSVVGCESFPWSITALSSANATVPLTIATSLGIHLHDYRSRPSTPADHDERVDGFGSTGAQYFYEKGLRNLFTDVPLPPYAPLAQPGSLSILHLQEPGSLADLSDDIYVAGRFTSILHYDRRMFPSIKDTIHSGGSLCSLTSSPYPFSGLCSERRRRGQMSVEDVEDSKRLPGGRTLIACGEYSSKGTLEIYGLSPSPDLSGKMEIAGHQNRYTASGAKLLSVVNHGARIAVSDAQGYVKWFERDGFTEIRRCRIGHCEGEPRNNQTGDVPPDAHVLNRDDMARKILATGPATRGANVNDNDLLFWTGDKLGTVGFSTKPGTLPQDFFDPEEVDERAREAGRYAEAVREALMHHAEEARWLGALTAGRTELP